MVKGTLFDEGGVVKRAEHGHGSGLLDGVSVFVAADESGNGIPFSDKKIKDIPSYKTWPNDEDLTSG